MEEYMPEMQLRQPAQQNATPQINERFLATAWRPHAYKHNHQHKQHQRPVQQTQQQSFSNQPNSNLSHDQTDHLKKEAARMIAEERRQLDEAEQILTMPGFVKAFNIFLRASQKK